MKRSTKHIERMIEARKEAEAVKKFNKSPEGILFYKRIRDMYSGSKLKIEEIPF